MESRDDDQAQEGFYFLIIPRPDGYQVTTALTPEELFPFIEDYSRRFSLEAEDFTIVPLYMPAEEFNAKLATFSTILTETETDEILDENDKHMPKEYEEHQPDSLLDIASKYYIKNKDKLPPSNKSLPEELKERLRGLEEKISEEEQLRKEDHRERSKYKLSRLNLFGQPPKDKKDEDQPEPDSENKPKM